MAYKALYRIYRPQNFDEVVGQKHILQTIRNAIKENKIAHAYLFSGPRGTGKTSMAKLLAKALNCEDEDVLSKPCNECENCQAINEGTHPDVIELDAASNNGVDEVRDIIDKVKYAPIMGKYKVYIIDEVHMMTPGAFNALLKTLEEPPAHVIFILATTDVHKVIPTIVSRCQRFDFNRVSKNDMKKRIEEILNNEQIEYSNDVIDLISELAEGGMRDALSILDQTIAYAGNELKGFGNLILIKHNDGWITAYAHNDKLLVRKGQKVSRGEKIATVGTTGGVNTPQLHFEIRRGKKPVNPKSYLP